MKKWIRISLWTLFITGTMVVLSFAHSDQRAKQMAVPIIQLTVQDGISLLTEEDIIEKLTVENLYRENITREELNISEIETYLKNLNEVEKAEVFMDLGIAWEINITIRRPIVRVLTKKDENGFYIDHHQKIMKTPPVVRPRTLIATGLENYKPVDWSVSNLINNDSLITQTILSEIYRISTYVCNSPLYRAQIVQIHYNEAGDFVLIPRVGRHEIIFGSAKTDEEVARKFKFLTTFYEEVIPFEGWNTYSAINLKFENQIVAKKK
jgi:cell division protein FtsQ